MSERQPSLEVPSNRALFDTLLEIPGNTFDAYSRFHNYSPRNLGFLALQGCPPEPVATYKKWSELGRQVQKGERAFSILRPIQVKLKGEQEEDEPKMIRRFKVVRALFSYGQTGGEELPEPETRDWSRDKALGALGINLVTFQSFSGNTGGYAVGRDIAINPVAPYPLRTLLHEMSHVEHGHTSPGGFQEYQQHRGHMEFEAESSAFLALNMLGELDDQTASVSRGYCQNWVKDNEVPEQTFGRSLNVTTKIVNAGYELEPAKVTA